MGAIIKPTAYISWIPLGKITVSPADAYISWLPMGTLSVTPGLCASIIPGSQKTKADTSRRVSKPVNVAGDTKRRISISVTETADTARIVGRTEEIAEDALRKVTATELAGADTKRRTYMPNGAFVAPQAYISWIPKGKYPSSLRMHTSLGSQWGR